MSPIFCKLRLLMAAMQVRSARATISAFGILAFSACQLAGCTTDEVDTGRLAWGDALINTSDRMDAYQLSLETLIDAIDGGAASTELCNPARSAESHREVMVLLQNLAADAPKHGFKEDVVEKLNHIQSQWQLLRTRQEKDGQSQRALRYWLRGTDACDQVMSRRRASRSIAT